MDLYKRQSTRVGIANLIERLHEVAAVLAQCHRACAPPQCLRVVELQTASGCASAVAQPHHGVVQAQPVHDVHTSPGAACQVQIAVPPSPRPAFRYGW